MFCLLDFVSSDLNSVPTDGHQNGQDCRSAKKSRKKKSKRPATFSSLPPASFFSVTLIPRRALGSSVDAAVHPRGATTPKGANGSLFTQRNCSPQSPGWICFLFLSVLCLNVGLSVVVGSMWHKQRFAFLKGGLVKRASQRTRSSQQIMKRKKPGKRPQELMDSLLSWACADLTPNSILWYWVLNYTYWQAVFPSPTPASRCYRCWLSSG